MPRGGAAGGPPAIPAARTPPDLDVVTARPHMRGAEVRGNAADVTDDDDVETLVEETVEAFDSLDILLNNAGFNPGDALGGPSRNRNIKYTSSF